MRSLQIPENARVDLGATVEGRFSPEDWEKIFGLAEDKWRAHSSRQDETEAWKEVVRDFHVSRYWGFTPNYRPKKERKPISLGIQFIWIAFNSFTITEMAITWLGDIYTRSDEPKDAWIFYSVLLLLVGNIVFFLWRNRAYTD